MDQSILNIVFGAIFSVFGWFAREMWAAVKTLKDDLSKLREELAKDYIRKDDFKEAIAELKIRLDRIFDKLDTKQDKDL